jgi:hypothetical protein
MKQKISFGIVGALLLVGGFWSLAARAQTVGVTIPTIPTGVSATFNVSGQVSVTWSASTESSGTIDGYSVYRNGVKVVTTADTLFIDAGLTAGVYNYTVAAFGVNGNVSAQSSPVSITVISDTTPPSVPTGVAVAGTTSTNSVYATTTLTISWSGSTDNVGVVGYNVYRNGVNIITSTSTFSGNSITDTVLPGLYTYTVAAYDAAQNISNRSAAATVTVVVDTISPSVPKNVLTQQVSGSGVNISWATSTDNIGVAGYQVFRNGIRIASATAPSYTDTGLTVGNTYTYTVTAYDAAGNISGQSSQAQELMQQANGPSAPAIMSAAFTGTSTINLLWGMAGDVVPISGYAIYRNGVQVASAVTSTEYSDEGLAPGMYSYGVTATDVNGAVSIASAIVNVAVPVVSAVTPATPVAPVTIATTTAATSSTPTSTSSSGSGTGTGGAAIPILTQSLYLGLRNAQVKSLQLLLIQSGNLLPAYATGYFGNLTLAAVEKFQCAQSVVCTGGAGWGLVGPKTRKVLNSL